MPKKPIVFEPLTLDLIRKHFVNFDFLNKSFYPIPYYLDTTAEDPNLNKELIYADPQKVFNNIFIPNGKAKWYFNKQNYILSDWLLSSSIKKDEEEILLEGVLKHPIEDKFINSTLEICDDNYIAEGCSSSRCWIQKLNKNEYPINNSKKILDNRKPYINDKYNTYKTNILSLTYKNIVIDKFSQKNLIPEDKRFGYTKINNYSK